MNYRPAAQSQQAQTQLSHQQETVVAIQKFESEIKRALPKHIDASRMTRIIITEVRKNPQLAECDKASFFGAIIQCAQLGLEPGSALGQCYLIPHRIKGKLEVQFMIGYRGFIDLMERSGNVTVEAHPVYEFDTFNYSYGLNPTLEHIPSRAAGRGAVVAAYAVARYRDGRCKFIVTEKQDLEIARSHSQSKNSEYSPWGKFYAEMAMKTAVKRLAKMIPTLIEMRRANEIDDQAELGKPQRLGDMYTAPAENLSIPQVKTHEADYLDEAEESSYEEEVGSEEAGHLQP